MARQPNEASASTSTASKPKPDKATDPRNPRLRLAAFFDEGSLELISPEDDTELRTVTLHNTGAVERTLELVSYFEPVLSQPKADEAHPAFVNLFVETRWEPHWRALLLARKPRLHGDAVMAVAHFLAATDGHLVAKLAAALDAVTGISGRRAERLARQTVMGMETPVHGAYALLDRLGLDTPFDISLPTKAAVAAARAAQAPRSEAGCFTERCGCAFARDYAGPFPEGIPLTSIYSRGDGVVWWEACIVPYARNVEVTGSHVGLAFNRKAYRAVAEALSAMLA